MRRVLIVALGILCTACGTGGVLDVEPTPSSGFTGNPPWPDTFPFADVRLNPDVDAGLAPSDSAQVRCQGGVHYALWSSDRTPAWGVYLNRSEDGGRTWLDAAMRVDDGTDESPFDARSPRWCGSDSTLHVVWQDDRDGQWGIYLRTTRDGGRTWTPSALRIDEGDTRGGDATGPWIACRGETVFVMWTDTRSGRNEIYLNRSDDDGRTWLASDILVPTDGGAEAGVSSPALCVSASYVHVAWHDARSGGVGIYANTSDDDGFNWLERDVRIDGGPAESHSTLGQLRCSGDVIHAVWTNDRRSTADENASDVYFSRSGNGGLSFFSEIRLNRVAAGAPPYLANSPRVAVVGENVYAVWSDARTGASHIHFNHSDDNGFTWLERDFAISRGPLGTSISERPRLQARGTTLYVVWEDAREGPLDLYAAASLDGGATWPLADIRIDRDASNEIPYEGRPDEYLNVRLCTDDEYAYAVWNDDRAGFADPYFTRGRPDTP